jgi:hypothetical protein
VNRPVKLPLVSTNQDSLDRSRAGNRFKILVVSSDDSTEVFSLVRVIGEGGWRVASCLAVSLSFAQGELVKLLLSMVASRLKAGYALLGNYVYEDLESGEKKRRKIPSKGNSTHMKGHTSVHEVAQHFHRPINDASKYLNICPTVLKKICRRAGLPRWPHRKLQSIQRELEKLNNLLSDVNQSNEQREGLIARINHLEKERRVICFEE